MLPGPQREERDEREREHDERDRNDVEERGWIRLFHVQHLRICHIERTPYRVRILDSF